MKKYLWVFLASLVFIQACKNAVIVDPPAQAEEDFWVLQSQDETTIRNIKMCSNGYLFAETPTKILRSTDNGEIWDVVRWESTRQPMTVGPNDDIYVAGGDANILFSFDYGKSWKVKHIDPIDRDITVYCMDTDKDGSV